MSAISRVALHIALEGFERKAHDERAAVRAGHARAAVVVHIAHHGESPATRGSQGIDPSTGIGRGGNR